jgi:hypothetical protein
MIFEYLQVKATVISVRLLIYLCALIYTKTNTIAWVEFVGEFRRYHISDGIMKLKTDEFCNLKQGNKTLS